MWDDVNCGNLFVDESNLSKQVSKVMMMMVMMMMIMAPMLSVRLKYLESSDVILHCIK